MWALSNRTPFEVERNWAVDKDGRRSWLVAVKATFDILEDGSTEVAAEQELPLLAPVFRGADGESSILYPEDLTPPKPAVDLVVNATAHAPGGQASEMEVACRVGDLEKRLVVVGDRVWEQGLVYGVNPSGPEPFETMPIIWERAYGGWDRSDEDSAKHRMEERNPVGVGFARNTDALVGGPVANIEDPKKRISGGGTRPTPAGFGAVPPYWRPRLDHAGTYDQDWMDNRRPFLPDDFDERFHQVAPVDQQLPGLRGGEPVELEGMSPEGPLAFTLPKLRFTFETFFGRESVEHRARLHTVVIEPDMPRLMMVWLTSLECHSRVDELDQTVVGMKDYIR